MFYSRVIGRGFLLALAACSVLAAQSRSDDADNEASTAVRVITADELARKDGVQSNEMWLSILGHVYDVTNGPEYYSEGAPYRIFVGRDGSASFVTGDFTPDGAAKGLFEVLSDLQIKELDDWKDFYDKEDKYPFVGVLQGELFDADGTPTAQYERIQQAIVNGTELRAEQDRKREVKIAERKRKDAEKKRLQEEQAHAEAVEL